MKGPPIVAGRTPLRKVTPDMNSGYVLVPSWLLDLQPDGAELRAYCHLASFGRFDTAKGLYEECRPSLASLSERSGLSETHLKRALSGLLGKGAIERTQRYAEDGKTCLPSVYRVIFGSLVGPGGAASGPGGGAADGPEGGPPVGRNPEPDTQNQSTQKKDTSSAPPRRGTRLPEDFVVSEQMRAWYRDNVGARINGAAEHEKFMDYWRAAAGAKGVKLDWPATWRNWMRTAMERAGTAPTSGAPAGAAAAGKPRYPSAAERERARMESEQEILLAAEKHVEEHGGNPEDGAAVFAVVARIKSGELPLAGRTVMPYIEGEIVRQNGATREVTSHASD